MPRLRTRSPFKRGPPPRLIVAMPAAERAGQRRTGGDDGRHAGSRSLGPASGRESDEPSSSVRAGRTAPHRSGLNPSCAMPRPATQQRTPSRTRPRMRRVRDGGGGDEPVYADRDDAGADPPCPAVLRTSCDTSHVPPIWARTSFAVRDGRRQWSPRPGHNGDKCGSTMCDASARFLDHQPVIDISWAQPVAPRCRQNCALKLISTGTHRVHKRSENDRPQPTQPMQPTRESLYFNGFGDFQH
jgi:hypothetical protein